MNIRTAAAAAGGLACAAAMAFTPAASAAPAPVKPAISTPGCIASFTSCTTPVVAVAIPSTNANELTPALDFALTYQGPSPLAGVAYGDVGVNFNNNLQNGTQDWSWVRVATVPHPGGGSGAYGFTGFDRHNYGGDGVYELEYTPNGIDSQLCLTVSNKFRHNGVVLGGCISRWNQVYIITQSAPGLEHAPGSYFYALEAGTAAESHATDEAQHNALLMPHPDTDDSLAAVGNPPHVAAGLASLALWNAIS